MKTKLHKNTVIQGITRYKHQEVGEPLEISYQMCLKWTGTVLLKEVTHNGVTLQLRRSKTNDRGSGRTFIVKDNVVLTKTNGWFDENRINEFVEGLPEYIDQNKHLFDEVIELAWTNYHLDKKGI